MNHVILKVYSGESNHLIREEYQQCLGKIVNTTWSMITMPDTGTLQENKHGYLPLPIILSPAASISKIVPGLKSYYLL